MIFSKIKSFISLSGFVRLLFIEALFTSAYVKITLLFLPFKKVAGWLGANGAAFTTTYSARDISIIEQVRFAIKLCDKYAPWPTECYTRALTVKLMLKRRHISSTLYFGFGRDEKGHMNGHAWLKSADILVTGFCDFSKFVVHTSFS